MANQGCVVELSSAQVHRGKRTVLDVPALTVGDTPFTVILGRNGSGKSTLMNVLAAQLRVCSGAVTIDGLSPYTLSARALARKIAYLPQQANEVAGLHVREVVSLGRFAWRGAFGRHGPQDHHAVDEALRLSGTTALATRDIAGLSGGERQRVWLAMLVAQQSPLMMLDEPVSALDVEHQFAVMALLHAHAQQTGNAVVVVLHDIDLACRFANRLIVLEAGKVCFDGSSEELQAGNRLEQLFGLPFVLINHKRLSMPVAVPVPPLTSMPTNRKATTRAEEYRAVQ